MSNDSIKLADVVTGKNTDTIAILYPHNHPNNHVQRMLLSIPPLVGLVTKLNPKAAITLKPYGVEEFINKTMLVHMTNMVVLSFLEDGIFVNKKYGVEPEKCIGKKIDLMNELYGENRSIHEDYAETVEVLDKTGLESNPDRARVLRDAHIHNGKSDVQFNSTQGAMSTTEVTVGDIIKTDHQVVLFVHPRVDEDTQNDIHKNMWLFMDEIKALGLETKMQVIDHPGPFGAFPSKLVINMFATADVVFQWMESKRWMVMKHPRTPIGRSFLHHSVLKLGNDHGIN